MGNDQTKEQTKEQRKRGAMMTYHQQATRYRSTPYEFMRVEQEVEVDAPREERKTRHLILQVKKGYEK